MKTIEQKLDHILELAASLGAGMPEIQDTLADISITVDRHITALDEIGNNISNLTY